MTTCEYSDEKIMALFDQKFNNVLPKLQQLCEQYGASQLDILAEHRLQAYKEKSPILDKESNDEDATHTNETIANASQKLQS